MSKQAHEEIDRLLGVEAPATEKPATDPRFANATAEEHGVTELKPTEHHDSVASKLEALVAQCSTLAENRKLPVFMGGLSRLLDEARAEGPGVVDHLVKSLWVAAAGIIDGTLKGSVK